METKNELNLFGIGQYRLTKNGKNWTAERLLTFGNEAMIEPAWEIIGGGQTLQSAAKALFTFCQETEGDEGCKDLIEAIKKAQTAILQAAQER